MGILVTYDMVKNVKKLLNDNISDDDIVAITGISPVSLSNLKRDIERNRPMYANEQERIKYSTDIVNNVSVRVLELADNVSQMVVDNFSETVSREKEIDVEYTNFLEKNVSMVSKLMSAMKSRDVSTVININQKHGGDIKDILDVKKLGN